MIKRVECEGCIIWSNKDDRCNGLRDNNFDILCPFRKTVDEYMAKERKNERNYVVRRKTLAL